MKHTVMWLDEKNKSKLGYRDVTLSTLTNECKVSHLLHAYTRDIMAEFKLPKNSQIVEGDTHPEPSSAGEKKVFKIYRWSPDDDKNPRVDTFTIDKDECGPMVLDL